MKMLKEFGEGVVTVLGICAYLLFFSALINFALRGSHVDEEKEVARLRIKPLPELRKAAFYELSAIQVNELDKMTGEWCGIFKCDTEIKKSELEVYEEFCKAILLDAESS